MSNPSELMKWAFELKKLELEGKLPHEALEMGFLHAISLVEQFNFRNEAPPSSEYRQGYQEAFTDILTGLKNYVGR